MVPPVDIPGKVRTRSEHHEHRHHHGRHTMRRRVLTSRDLSEAEREADPGFPGAPRSIEYPYAGTYRPSHGGRGRDSSSIFLLLIARPAS